MLFTCTEENSSRWDIGKVNSTYSICFSKIVTHDAKMNVMRMVYFSLDIICTCWVLRKSKWTCGRNSVSVQYPVVIWAVKAHLLMWEHRVLFLGLFEGRVVLLLVRCCPVTECQSRWQPVLCVHCWSESSEFEEKLELEYIFLVR